MTLVTNISIYQVQSLLEDLEAGDVISAAEQLDKITQLRNHELYSELDKISKNLNETLKNIDDEEILHQVKFDLPDVSERLDYILDSTEKASEQTLTSSENLIAMLGDLRAMSESFAPESKDKIEDLLNNASSEVNQILMAQSYQDLTGQVLNRIKITISCFERSLRDLIDQSGLDLEKVAKKDLTDEEELQGIGPNVTKSSKKDSASSQDDVDDLLDSLGI